MKSKIEKIEFNKDFFSDGLFKPCESIQKIINQYWNKKLSPRYKWTEDQVKRLVPKWQQKLMLRKRNNFLVWLFGWRVGVCEYSSGTRINVSIFHYNKLIISKTFNEK